MILSFHPLFEGDRQIICAGRDPNEKDLAAIKAAKAVVLPQGCRESLYLMAKNNCPFVFPNYDTRFTHPGKLKQTELFVTTGVPHPKTIIFENVCSFSNRHPSPKADLPFNLPFVFKFDWGGEGDFVFLIDSFDQLTSLLGLAVKYERSGQKGFMFQEFINCGNRSLRVVVIYETMLSYWREHGENEFYANLSKGATVNKNADPLLCAAAEKEVKKFCDKTAINLAGFDLIYSQDATHPIPLFLEINYFFGRKGLGGSERYYALLMDEINKWLNHLEI